MGSQGKDVIHLLLYQLCMISKHDFHVEYYSTCPYILLTDIIEKKNYMI
jgi:hypothetical protein